MLRRKLGFIFSAVLAATLALPVAAGTAEAVSSTETPPIPTVGAVYWGNAFSDTAYGHWCTGTVINTPKRNIVLTAAHCLNQLNLGINPDVFIPAFDKHAKNQEPFGKWRITAAYSHPKYGIRHHNPDYDMGLLVLEKRHGKNIQDVVGAQNYQLNAPISGYISVFGYPHATDWPLYCGANAVVHHVQGHRDEFQIDCGKNFGDGVSGSALMVNYNTTTHQGTVVANVGGDNQGGNADGELTYGHRLDNDFKAFLDSVLRKA